MIPRYQQTDLAQIWSEKSRFQTYLEVELALMKARAELVGKGPTVEIVEKIAQTATIDPERIAEIEKKTRHDMIAFCTSITDQIPPEWGQFFHFGATSSDIIDTATTLQISRSLQLTGKEWCRLLHLLHDLGKKYLQTPAMGRSHGRYAEPMSFGQKFLSYYAQFWRVWQGLQSYRENQLTGQMSGPVGNYPINSPQVEERVMEILGLKVETISTQVIPRDRIFELISLHAAFANCLEALSVEIRHLHRSEVAEVMEGFSSGQKGSSAMPHKKNPIATENLTGIARVLRSHLMVASENCVLWHERDISHSSAERMLLPDNLGLVLYSLRRLNSTLENLVVCQDNIEKRVKENGEYASGLYLAWIIENTDWGRDRAYQFIQKVAFEFAQNSRGGGQEKSLPQFHEHFQKLWKEEMGDTPLSLKEISPMNYLQSAQTVYQRVIKNCPLPVMR